MRREGKIGRRKVFSEVKNVNVESLKNGSKLLFFWRNFSTKRLRVKGTKSQRDKESKRSLPQPLPKGKGFGAALMHRTQGSFWGVKETKRRREEESKSQRD